MLPLTQTEETQQDYKLQTMISVLRKEIDILSDNNRDQVKSQYTQFIERLTHALSTTEARDPFVYRPDDMLTAYGTEFLSYLDPLFAQDIKANKEWYLENQNEILLDVGYPSK